eukprot:TRINITY_DN3224_c0_g2_i6.p1 TRINITY_DN3224_c0_g2~~TRINITY_DN3224_c0_g2_i6.p1  ORF type:complete len:296 (-),score=49.63 TRINITY_DN3224_c0_g2_i6:47-934(-)
MCIRDRIIRHYKKHMDQVEDGSTASGFWRLRRVRGHRPTCRESAKLELVGDKFYLFGGYGVDRMNDLWCLAAENPDMEGHVWTLVRPLGTAVPERRYGHCMASYRNGVYVFGGSSDFIAGLKTRVVLDDMWKYSIEDNQWRKIETSKYKFKSSMYAASCVFERLWFIHGGTDGNGGTLSSSISYLLGTFHAQGIDFDRTVELIVGKKSRLGDRIGPLAMHTAVPVIPPFLSQRSSNTNYWQSVHKWNFAPNDDLIVLFMLSVGQQNWYLPNRWTNKPIRVPVSYTHLTLPTNREV